MGSAGANANLANVSVGVSGSSLWNSNNNAAGNGSAGAVIQDTLHFNSRMPVSRIRNIPR